MTTTATDLPSWLIEQIEANRRRIERLRQSTAEDEGWDNETRAEIAAEHDPVMIDLDSKLKIIEWCAEVIGPRDLSNYGRFGALQPDPDALAVTLAVETLRLLALPYAPQSGYRDEWRP